MSRPEFDSDWSFFSKSLMKILEKKQMRREIVLLQSSRIKIEETGWDNWDGGTPIFTVYLEVTIDQFAELHDELKEIESRLDIASETLKKLYPQIWFRFEIVPSAVDDCDPHALKKLIDKQKDLMISVATGGPKIREVNDEYIERRRDIASGLTALGEQDPNPYFDLWQWYKKWSEDFSTWASRRVFIAEMYGPVLERVLQIAQTDQSIVVVTGWERVDRVLAPIPSKINTGSHEEDFQTVGLQCREVLVTLAQQVYDVSMASKVDQKPSKTDAKRMLDAFVTTAVSGESRKLTRKLCRSTIDLANELTHKRSASKQDARLCFLATKNTVSIIHCLDEEFDRSCLTHACDCDNIPF